MTKWSDAKDAVKEAVASASDHAADDAGMLEALISVALTTLAEIKGGDYAKNFIDYETSSRANAHVDIQRLT